MNARPPVLLCLLAVVGCGGSSVSALPTAARQALCNELLNSARESIGCGLDELTAGTESVIDARYRVTADVEFRPDGRMTRFSRLRMIVDPPVAPNVVAPMCVESLIRDLRVGARADAITVPLSLRLEPGAGASAAALVDGSCGLTIPTRAP